MTNFTISDIDTLIKEGRTIILVGKKVYDVTAFTDHPGGQRCLVKKKGQDCTADILFHSSRAQKYMKKYLIGSIGSIEGNGSINSWIKKIWHY